MYKQNRPEKTQLKVNFSYTGETIEQKVRRIMNNKEPIKDGAPLLYTERKDGVRPEYNPRTDRFELAVDAMDYVTKTHSARREERHKPKTDPKPPDGPTDGGTPANPSDGQK